MKVVFLAGGYGTRFSEETVIRPKPMIEIGGKPILWHLMKYYSHYGYNEFVVCLGHKGYYAKEYFANYFLHQSDVTIDIQKNEVDVHHNSSEPWKITLVNTGLGTQTGARVRKIRDYVDGTFMLTYGDGLSNVNLEELLAFHREHGKVGTMTSIQPAGRFGVLQTNPKTKQVEKFHEKPQGDSNRINGGFFVFEPRFFDYLEGDDQLILEREPLEKLTRDQELFTYEHQGFWKCMDNKRDHGELEKYWETDPPWKVW